MSTKTALKLLTRSTASVIGRNAVSAKPMLTRGIAFGRLSAVPQVRPTWSPMRAASISQGKLPRSRR